MRFCRASPRGMPANQPLDPAYALHSALDAGLNDVFAVSRIGASHRRPALGSALCAGYVPTPGWRSTDAIEQDIRELCQRYAVQQLAYDPFLLGQTVRRLTNGPNAIRTPCDRSPRRGATPKR